MYKDISTLSQDSTDLDAIKNSIRNIILTPRGSLPGKPNFGCDIYNIIFKPLDSLTEAMARNYINEAINKFENRINISDIEIKREEAFNKMIIDIKYSYDDNTFNSESTVEESVAISINI